MASALQPPAWSSKSRPAGQGINLANIEHWFFRQGVPQFVYGYGPGRTMLILRYLLLIVVAFDLAIQPWVSLNPWFVLIAPAALVFLGLILWLIVKATIIDQASYLIDGLTKAGTVKDKRSWVSFKAQITYLTSNPAGVSKLFASVYVTACLIFLLGSNIYWSDYTVNFVVIAVLLATSVRLFRPDVWSGDDTKFRERRRLYAVIVIAVICFAFEGSILPDSTAVMGGVIGSVVPAAVPVPQALAALIVAVFIAAQSQGLIPEPSMGSEAAAQQPSKAREDVRQQPFNVFFPAVPLLVLVFCAETAILPYVGPTWCAAVLPPAAMVGVASLHVLPRRRQHKPTPNGATRRSWWLKTRNWLKEVASYSSVRGFINYPGVTALVVLYLVACPVLVAALAASEGNQPSTDIPGDAANVRSAFLLTSMVNLFYASLVVGIAVFGLLPVAKWAIKEAWTNLLERLSNLGRGLSILVVFAALALLTQETWETMLAISTKDYLLLVGSILGLTGAFHLITAIHHLTKEAKFGTWSEVRSAAMSEQEPSQNDKHAPSENDAQEKHLELVGPVPSPTDAFTLVTAVQHSTEEAEFGPSSEVHAAATPTRESPENDQPTPSQNDDHSLDREIKDLLDSEELSDLTSTSDAPKHRLGGLEAINSVIVSMTYEIIFFFPVTIIAAFAFFVFGYVTVPSHVAANWIHGDRATEKQADDLTRLPFFQQPWARVALLLTAFSILYLAVELLSDPDKRNIFFGSADKAVRKRLAVRLAYREVLAHRGLLDQGQRRPS
jgi:hypothetical protein